MLSLYGRRTRRLSALGLSDLANHQTCVKLSTVRLRSTVTHAAGDGILAGL